MRVTNRIHVGFSGTRHGMNANQAQSLNVALGTAMATARQVELFQPPIVFHHGDCVGADEQAHLMATSRGMLIKVHPPINGSLRANCQADLYAEAKDFLDRNEDIAKESDYLIITPDETIERQRSGTWATKRYAQRLKKAVLVLYPDGSTEWV